MKTSGEKDIVMTQEEREVLVQLHAVWQKNQYEAPIFVRTLEELCTLVAKSMGFSHPLFSSLPESYQASLDAKNLRGKRSDGRIFAIELQDSILGYCICYHNVCVQKQEQRLRKRRHMYILLSIYSVDETLVFQLWRGVEKIR